jgi:hypothetical protein
MINLLQKKRVPSSILGLALEGNRLEGIVVRRTNGSLQAQKTFAAALTINPMSGDPELAGREIRNHLDQAGIRERRCVVGVPLSWALTLQAKIPEVPEEDVAGFLEIEAERGFPYGPEALSSVTSRYRSTSGEEFATLVAVPQNHLVQLEKVLRSAQLRPASFTLAMTALQGTGKKTSNVLALAIGENTIDLQVTYEGGVVTLRALEGVIETEGVQRELQAGVMAREIRVTLAQLPDEIRAAILKARIFGPGEFAQRVVEEAGPQLQAMGLQPEWVKAYAPDEFRSKPPPETPVSAAFSMAARYLTGAKSEFEFLPPKVSSFQQLTSRFSSRKMAWAGATAAAAAVMIGGTVGVQQWQLGRLRSQWSAMEPKVRELEGIQQQIRRFRPWFDDSFLGLTILRRVTESFPVEGVVTAKTLEIHDLSTITCSGTARDNEAFLKMLNQLRTAREVGEVKVDSVRGKAPLQFTLNFQWGQRRQGEN